MTKTHRNKINNSYAEFCCRLAVMVSSKALTVTSNISCVRVELGSRFKTLATNTTHSICVHVQHECGGSVDVGKGLNLLRSAADKQEHGGDSHKVWKYALVEKPRTLKNDGIAGDSIDQGLAEEGTADGEENLKQNSRWHVLGLA